jgi:uncharacterized protein (DUF2141 family)
MSKLSASLIASAVALAVPCAPASAAILGPHAAACSAGADRPAMLVKITGLKARTGILRVQSYGGDPSRFFDKGTYLERVEVRPPASGPIEVCMPVPRSGGYAVSVRHDINGSGKSDLGDGAGMSGNPNVSLMDVLFKRKPSPNKVTVEVKGVERVRVVMNYVRGTSVGPVPNAKR